MTEKDNFVMKNTGERMIPELSCAITFWEHVYRYRFAKRFVPLRRVLDIACGEGYGTASLAAAGAKHVIGIDICKEACERARRKYNVDARVGNAENIPMANCSVDLVVSFETVEHLARPHLFIQECARVLTSGGMLVISTPNRLVYNTGSQHNIFHKNEMDYMEFQRFLNVAFTNVRFFSQCPVSPPFWSLRSLSVDKSPWFRVRGIGRLLRSVQAFLCPHLGEDVLPEYRKSPVETMLLHNRPLASVVDPFEIRKYKPYIDERPKYFVAVAVKRESWNENESN